MLLQGIMSNVFWFALILLVHFYCALNREKRRGGGFCFGAVLLNKMLTMRFWNQNQVVAVAARMPLCILASSRLCRCSIDMFTCSLFGLVNSWTMTGILISMCMYISGLQWTMTGFPSSAFLWEFLHFVEFSFSSVSVHEHRIMLLSWIVCLNGQG